MTQRAPINFDPPDIPAPTPHTPALIWQTHAGLRHLFWRAVAAGALGDSAIRLLDAATKTL